MSLLQMSFSGAVFILVIVMVRAVMINRLPKRTFLVLWGIVLIRLLVPVSVPSPVSVYSLLGRNEIIRALSDTFMGDIIPGMQDRQANVTTAGPLSQLNPAQLSQIGNLQIQFSQTEDSQVRSESLQHSAADMRQVPAWLIPVWPASVWLVVWCVGMVLGIVFFTIFYLRWYFRFQAALPVHNDYIEQWLDSHKLERQISVKQSDRVAAPLTYGVLHPVILLPKKTDWENTKQLKYVLLHEYVHIRRFDTVTKIVTAIALCIHWFNPFVWVMYILFNRDMELSCDESVVRLSGITSRSDYAHVLIDMEAGKSGLMPFYNNFSKNAIEERIASVMKIKKTSLTAIVIATVLTIGLVAVFATSALSADNENTIVELTEENTTDELIEVDPDDATTFEDVMSNDVSSGHNDDPSELLLQDPQYVEALAEQCIWDNIHNVYLGKIENEEIRMIITREGERLSAAYITRNGEEKFFNGELNSDLAKVYLHSDNGEYLEGSLGIDDKGFFGVSFEGELSGKTVDFTVNWETFFSFGEDTANYYSFMRYDSKAAEQFAKQIKDSAGNAEAFARLVRYPISIELDGEEIMVENEKEMTELYDRLMGENGFGQQVENMFTKYLFANYQGICVEDGIIWFNIDRDDKYKITAINPPRPDDARELEDFMTMFYTAYFNKERETLQRCFADSFDGRIDLINEINSVDDIEIIGIKGLDSWIPDDAEVILSLEFLFPNEDSYSYLTAGLIKDNGVWKVEWYGLEK